ncbi:MAG: hypothetical protein ACRD2Z_03230 [Thermoanaerobaculia bacterium]
MNDPKRPADDWWPDDRDEPVIEPDVDPYELMNEGWDADER